MLRHWRCPSSRLEDTTRMSKPCQGPQDMLDLLHTWLPVDLQLAPADGTLFTDWRWILVVVLGPTSAVIEGMKTTDRSSSSSLTRTYFCCFSKSLNEDLDVVDETFKYFHNLYILFHRLQSLHPSFLLTDSASLRRSSYSASCHRPEVR